MRVSILDKKFIISNIELTFQVRSKEFSKSAEEIIANFKVYMPIFKSDKTNILFMMNEEKDRKLLYYMNRFQFNIDSIDDRKEQIEYINNVNQIINDYFKGEDKNYAYEYTLFYPYENVRLSEKIEYPASLNKLSRIGLYNVGLKIEYLSKLYDIHVFQGVLEEEENESSQKGFIVKVSQEIEIDSSEEWEENWTEVLEKLPLEIISLIQEIFI